MRICRSGSDSAFAGEKPDRLDLIRLCVGFFVPLRRDSEPDLLSIIVETARVSTYSLANFAKVRPDKPTAYK